MNRKLALEGTPFPLNSWLPGSIRFLDGVSLAFIVEDLRQAGFDPEDDQPNSRTLIGLDRKAPDKN